MSLSLSTQQRRPFRLLPILFLLRILLIPLLLHTQPLPTADFLHAPTAPLRRLLEELLVLLKRAASALGTVPTGPPGGESVGDGEDEEEPVSQVVEADGGEQGDGEVGDAPDDDGDGGALGAGGGGVDLGGHEPGGHEPADAEGRGGEVEDDDAGDAGGEVWDVQRVRIVGEPAEEREQQERAGEDHATVDHEGATAEAVNQHPRKCHHAQVEEVVSEGDVFGRHDAEAEEFEDLRAVDGDGAVTGQGLVYLAHDRDDGGVKLGFVRVEHVDVADLTLFLLFLVGFDHGVEKVVGLFFAEDVDQTVLCFVIVAVENVPSRGLWEPGDHSEEEDWVDVHDDDGETPCPLVIFTQDVGQDDIDDEGHVQSKNVGLEFLGQCCASGFVGGEFGTVDRDYCVNSTDSEAHNHSPNDHESEGTFGFTQSRDEHEKVSESCGSQTQKNPRLASFRVCVPRSKYATKSATQVVYGDDDAD